MIINDFIKDILCILVIYKTKPEESLSFTSLTSNLQRIDGKLDILIYDNSPLSSNYISTYDNSCWNIQYIHDANNPGVSFSYNTGYKIAQKMNKKWLLLLDQDTFFPENILELYFESATQFSENKLFVPILVHKEKIISPCSFYFNRGSSMKNVNIGINSIKNKSVLNSGLLIDLVTFAKVGGYNDKIKLDYSDFFFINRYRKVYSNFVVINSLCMHHIASSTEKDLQIVVKRYINYCEGIRNYAEGFATLLSLFVLVFSRSIKMSFRFKTIIFFKIFIKHFILGKS